MDNINPRSTKNLKPKARAKTSHLQYTGHIKLLGLGASDTDQRFIKLRLSKANGGDIETVERIDNLRDRGAADSMIKRLNGMGAHLITDAAARELLQRIQDVGPQDPSFYVATQVGWRGKVFIRPDQIIGAKKCSLERYFGDIPVEIAGKYDTRGTLDGWQEIGRLARGNSRFMLALSLSLVGPLGDILNVEQPAFQLVGEGQSGKTGIFIAAGSVWGRHVDRNRARSTGFGETWNSTANALEPIAAAHSHTFLPLEETRSSEPSRGLRLQTILDIAFRLERSVEKGRLTSTSVRSWWVPVLSTSNKSLDEMAKDEDVVLDEAYRSRLIDVPLPVKDSAFENLHNFRDKTAFTKQLLKLSRLHFGWAALTFLERLVAWRCRNAAELRGWLRGRRRIYLREAHEIVSSGRDLSRFHEKFATVYAAGCLGIKFGLFPWTRTELFEALLSCERAHVEHVEKFLGKAAANEPLAALCTYIRDHHKELRDLRDGLLEQHDNPSEYLGFINEHDGKLEFLLLDEAFEKIAGRKALAQRLKRELFDKNLLDTTAGGEQGTRYVVKRRLVDGKGRQSVIAVSATILS